MPICGNQGKIVYQGGSRQETIGKVILRKLHKPGFFGYLEIKRSLFKRLLFKNLLQPKIRVGLQHNSSLFSQNQKLPDTDGR
jgi:hypothetical protein